MARRPESVEKSLQTREPRHSRRPKASTEPIIFNKLIEGIRVGMHADAACELAGIARRTFENYKTKARAGDPKYVRLFDRIRKAERELERSWLIQIQKIALRSQKEDWKAFESLLKRRFRAQWGERVDVTVLDDEKVTKIFAAITTELGHEATERVFKRYLETENAPVLGGEAGDPKG